jgi:hypothetical protein
VAGRPPLLVGLKFVVSYHIEGRWRRAVQHLPRDRRADRLSAYTPRAKLCCQHLYARVVAQRCIDRDLPKQARMRTGTDIAARVLAQRYRCRRPANAASFRKSKWKRTATVIQSVRCCL